MYYSSSIGWEEHLLLKEDTSALTLLIVSFLVNASTMTEIKDVDLRIYSADTPGALLFPSNASYPEVASLSVSKDQLPLIVPDYFTIRITFNEAILGFWRYSVGLLITLPRLIQVQSPWLYGETQLFLDYTLWLQSSGSGERVPWGQLSGIVEGQRFESNFPYVTITYPARLRLDRSTPPVDTERDGMFYVQGIYQEYKDKTIRVIPTYLVSPLIAMGQINVENLTFEYSPFPPEDRIMQLWRSFAKQGESYHTIGWFKAPSHVNLTITNPERKIVLDNLLVIMAIFGVLPVIWQISRRRNKRRLADGRKKKQRKQKVRHRP